MKRQARCWICGAVFEAQRGALPKGARFACAACADDGLQPATGSPLSHAALARALYERHGVPYLDLSHVAVPEEVLRLVPEDFARHHSLLPLLVAPAKPKAVLKGAGEAKKSGAGTTPLQPGALVVAMADPANGFALESLRRSSGLPVQCFVSTWAEIAEAIGEQYLRIAVAEGSSD